MYSTQAWKGITGKHPKDWKKKPSFETCNIWIELTIAHLIDGRTFFFFLQGEEREAKRPQLTWQILILIRNNNP